MAASAIVIQQKVGRIADLLEQRLGLQGPTLRKRVQQGRRRLPADLRGAVDRLCNAEAMAMQPRLLLQIDDAALDRDYRLLVKRLEAMPVGHARHGAVHRFGQSLKGALVSLTLLGFAFLGWTLSH